MELVDKNSENIPDGDYLQMCDTIKELRERVKPPPFLMDQNQPLWVSENTGTPERVPTYQRSTPDWTNYASIFEGWEGVRVRGNTDEMTQEDLALVALAVAHETDIAEATYTVQNGHS
tara:strand:+ start:4962 stop:5315 length:354 start_codon:yes stop_codon:yes gene_type:complete